MKRFGEWFEHLLRSLGLVKPYDDNDIINASTEDAARTHDSVLRSLQDSIKRRIRSHDTLRRSITIAKDRTDSFAEFEEHIRRHDK